MKKACLAPLAAASLVPAAQASGPIKTALYLPAADPLTLQRIHEEQDDDEALPAGGELPLGARVADTFAHQAKTSLRIAPLIGIIWFALSVLRFGSHSPRLLPDGARAPARRWLVYASIRRPYVSVVQNDGWVFSARVRRDRPLRRTADHGVTILNRRRSPGDRDRGPDRARNSHESSPSGHSSPAVAVWIVWRYGALGHLHGNSQRHLGSRGLRVVVCPKSAHPHGDISARHAVERSGRQVVAPPRQIHQPAMSATFCKRSSPTFGF